MFSGRAAAFPGSGLRRFFSRKTPKEEDLLRIKENGDFVSLYPSAGSGRVLDAINNGGTIWP